MSDNEDKPKPGAGDAAGAEHVNLKVCGQDGSVVQFKIKKNTQLKKLMNSLFRKNFKKQPKILRLKNFTDISCAMTKTCHFLVIF